MGLVKLVFTNSDARPKSTMILCDTMSVAPIMAWYGSHHAGDRYTVTADGVELTKDQNGELVT